MRESKALAGIAKERPSGAELAREIRAWSRSNRLSLTEAAELIGKDFCWLRRLEDIARPKPETVAAVRRVTRTETEPEYPGASGTARKAPGAVSSGTATRTTGRAPQQPEPVAIATSPAPPTSRAASLADIAAREAEDAVRRRKAARSVGPRGGSRLSVVPIAAALQAGLIEEPHEAMRAVARRWPDLWRRIIDDAHAAGELPGAYFFDAVRAGLEALSAGTGR